MKRIIIFTILLIIILGACFLAFHKKEGDVPVIRLISTDSIHTAPFHVMKELKLIEKYAPDVKVEYAIGDGGTAVDEAIIADKADIGVTSITNFAIGFNKGIPYKIASAIGYARTGLQTNNPNIKSLKDIGPDDRIAVASPTGGATIYLKMACEKEFGNLNALEDNLIVMDTYAAQLALINKSSGISLHMDSLATILYENREGCPTILDDVAVMGGKYASVVTVAANDFVEKNPDLYNAYLLALEEATALINNKDEQALEIVFEYCKIKKEDIVAYLDSGNLFYTTTDFSVLPFTDFLYKTGQIPTKIESLQDISFPNVTAKK